MPGVTGKEFSFRLEIIQRLQLPFRRSTADIFESINA